MAFVILSCKYKFKTVIAIGSLRIDPFRYLVTHFTRLILEVFSPSDL